MSYVECLQIAPGGRLCPSAATRQVSKKSSETDPRVQTAQAKTVRDQKEEVLSTRRDERACRQ
jgi:hypothetical protein